MTSSPERTTNRWMEATAASSVLLLASGALLCCALPLLLVSLGLGATVAALVSAAPWLVALSHYKVWTFVISGTGLLSAGFFLYRPGRTCPADPRLAHWCALADRWNRGVFVVACVLWSAGAFAAYLWLPLRRWLAL